MNNHQKYDGRIDILKFLFSLGVIGIHTKLMGYDFKLIPCGNLGVDFFFVLSGYFTVKAALSDEPNQIYAHVKKRIFNLMPYYVMAVLFSTIVLIVENSAGWKNILCASFFDFIPFQMMGFSSNVSTAVQWFVGVLFIADILVYFLVNKYKDIFVKIIGPLLGVVLLGLVAMSDGNLESPGSKLFGGPIYSGMVRGIADMFLSCAVYNFAKKLKELHVKKWVVTIIRVVILAAMVTLMFKTFSMSDFVFVFLTVAYLSLLLSDEPSRFWKRNKITEQLRNISLVLFMVHYAVGKLINHYLSFQDITLQIIEIYGISILVAFGLFYMAKGIKALLHKWILPHLLVKQEE